MVTQPLRIVCYVPSFNAGDTSRAVEVAIAVERKAVSCGRATDITFLCPPVAGPNFEHLIRRAGFKIGYTAVPLDDQTIQQFMDADRAGDEFTPNFAQAKRYAFNYMEDMQDRRPDLVIIGCIPTAGVAARILRIPMVTYLPFPNYKEWVSRHLMSDLPDDLENALTTRLPGIVRRHLAAAISKLATRNRFFTQPTLAAAARELGWRESAPDFFSMLRADVELVPDLPELYDGQNIGPRARITGPLFSRPEDSPIDPKILQILRPKNPNKVLVTMGSSAEKSYLLEAIAAIATGEFNAVVVVQPTICSISEVRKQIQIPESVYLTDSFIPAHQINPLVDATVIHGGQGTVQTTMSSGKPFVGVGMQVEQQRNLDSYALRGAGIRIARGSWESKAIKQALHEVLTKPHYQARAHYFAEKFAAINGQAEAGDAIWEMVTKLCL